MNWLRRYTGVCILLGGGLSAVAAEDVGLSTLLEARVAANRGLNLLLARQRADGSWAGDAPTTVQVFVCLANAPGLDRDARSTAARTHALAYLRQAAQTALAVPAADADGASAETLAAVMPALARAGRPAHRELLSHGRARLLALSLPVQSSSATPGRGFAPRPGAAVDLRLSCLAVDALLVSEGLGPDWDTEGYRGLAAALRQRLGTLLHGDPAPAEQRPDGGTRSLAGGRQLEAAALARALLSLGSSPAERPLADALLRLAAVPPRHAETAFALAEALRITDAAPDPAMSASLRGWPERLIEALLGAQMGDGGWPASGASEPRDRATAYALRAIQVAAGQHLDEAATPRPWNTTGTWRQP